MGEALRSFAMALLVLEALWGFTLAGLCLWLVGHGSWVRGIVAGVVALVVVTGGSFVLATYYAAVRTMQKAVKDAGLGSVIFHQLFEHALGVSGEDAGVRPAEAILPTHLSAREVKAKLDAAARMILSEEGPSTSWSLPFFWLARQIQKIAVWATVRVVVRACSHDGGAMNLYELRDRLASMIDEMLLAQVTQYFYRFALAVMTILSGVVVLIALGIRYLPM